MDKKLLDLKKQVESLEGSTIGTVWGECTVGKVFGDEEKGILYVELNEDGEDFIVKLEEWEDALM